MSDEFPSKYYVNQSGKYLGQFSGYVVEANAEIPRHMVYAIPDDVDAIEVDLPPGDGRQIYDLVNKIWLSPPA